MTSSTHGDHEGAAAAFERQVAAAQRFRAQLAHQVDPALGLAVVLVVPGDVDPGVGGLHRTQRSLWARRRSAVPSAMSPVWQTRSASRLLTVSQTRSTSGRGRAGP